MKLMFTTMRKEEKRLMSFFVDLINITPVHHLIKYWYLWISLVVVCFAVLRFIKKDNKR